ncbi:MLO-like protein 10 [Ancistrocladus abbreviatus]
MAGDAGGGEAEKTLAQTPTWAVTGVCLVIILISLILEKVLHKIGEWFKKRNKKGLYDALEKVKSELMILGFISLLLTFGQKYIAKVCVPHGVAVSMLPCLSSSSTPPLSGETKGRRLLWNEHRILAAEGAPTSCKQGFEPLISVNGIHQLHMLIFFLAVFHVFYSAITMWLGRQKIRSWKKWEDETSTHDYEFSHDPSRFRLAHETSFVRAHNSFWLRNPLFFYVGCFFRQFFRSVKKTDYLTLRNGFIAAHIAPGSKFDFRRYIKSSLEDDFKVVVGVSPVLWASCLIFLLLNVRGWHTLVWASPLPVIIILAVGTKLQAILSTMAIEITDRHAVVQGIPLVQGSDEYFWFSQPRLVLHLLHFMMFQNSFQITYFLWSLYENFRHCLHESPPLEVIKLSVGSFALILSSYTTLPLYALLSQMGSNMKRPIFDEQTAKALNRWHQAAKKKLDKQHGRKSPSRTPEGSSRGQASVRPLQRHWTTGHSTHYSVNEEHDMSDQEADDQPLYPTNVTVSVEHNQETEMTVQTSMEETRINNDFSFAKMTQAK